MATIPKLASTLQNLFTLDTERIAKKCKFIRRQRKLSSTEFVQTLVFGWINNPQATFDSFAPQLGVSAEALRKRCTTAAHDLFKKLISHALSQSVSDSSDRPRLMKRFTAVIVEDCTTIPLPPDAAKNFPASGGTKLDDNAAGMKLFFRWNILSGEATHISTHPATTSDVVTANEADAEQPLLAGSLHIVDLGFFDSVRRRKMSDSNVFWLTRVKAGVHVQTADGKWVVLADWLQTLPKSGYDGPCVLGKTNGVACRIVARRVPPEVAKKRRENLNKKSKKSGKPISDARWNQCDWQVLATNLSNEYSYADLYSLYRSRWQIELLFRRCKQRLGWSETHGRTEGRVVLEVLAKVLGAVVVLWGALLRGGPLGVIGHDRSYCVVIRCAEAIRVALRGCCALVQVLTDMATQLFQLRVPGRRKKKTTRQQLA